MHDWSEKDFDWKGLDDAIRFIDFWLVFLGRINVRQSKEKFGTARIYCSLGWHQFHSITHPRSAFNRYPKWLWKWDCDYGSKIVKFLFCWVVQYHAWLYRTVYWIAVRRWKHLREEILCCADYDELLKGL